MEDAVFDRVRKISYAEITSKEKREVFQLPAVRRSMRHLQYAHVLMSKEILQLANRYMEFGPARATLQQIGYESLQAECEAKTVRDEYRAISPFIHYFSYARGYHPVGYFVGIAAIAGFAAFHVGIIRRTGMDIISAISLAAQAVSFLVLTLHCFKPSFKNEKRELSVDKDIERMSLSGMCYLRLHGMDVLAAAQERLAAETSQDLRANDSSIRTLKDKFIKDTAIESLTVHLLIGVVPCICSCVTSSVRWWAKGETLMALGALSGVWATIGAFMMPCQVAFFLRLGQRLSDFEIRRCEADIRTCPPNMIHRITPRFKQLLHECHSFGNRCHGMLYFFAPFILLYSAQMVLGIMQANFSSKENGDICVPYWVFFSTFQPVISMLLFVHGFGHLNLAIERDCDQDIVELNIKLTYSETHVPNWLLQQVSEAKVGVTHVREHGGRRREGAV